MSNSSPFKFCLPLGLSPLYKVKVRDEQNLRIFQREANRGEGVEPSGAAADPQRN